MQHKTIMASSIVVIVIGIALPLLVALQYSWQRAINLEQIHLRQYADRAIDRAERNITEIDLALQRMQNSEAVPCSMAHILEMRAIALETRSIEEVRYYQDGRLRCTSWETVDQREERSASTDIIQHGDLTITLNVESSFSKKRRMVELRRGNYVGLTDPMRFVDVIVNKDIQIAVGFGDGRILAVRNTSDPRAIAKAFASNTAPSLAGKITALQARRDMMVLVVAPDSYAAAEVNDQRKWLLPCALAVGGIFATLVLRSLRRRLSLYGRLVVAIKKRELQVHYQPIIDLRTGLCVGAEALVRWIRHDGAVISPDLFIPVAEEHGLIYEITDQVFANVRADMAKLLAGDRGLHIAINLSAEDVRTGRFLAVLKKELSGTEIEASQIWLEATERGFLEPDAACRTLSQARRVGYAVSIDDFGTGYSSLASLQSLPLDSLKIDKAFVNSIDTHGAQSQGDQVNDVTSHIIAMGKSLGLRMIAEGIETQVQLDYLVKRGVEFGQGWIFSRALPAATFIEFYKDRNRGQGQKG